MGEVWLTRGARVTEAALIRAVLEASAAGISQPGSLSTPVRVVVPSRSLRQHVSSALVRERGGSLVGLSVQTLHTLALEILERSGAPGPASDALVPIRVRQLARREPALHEPLNALEDGYGVVEGAVSDLLDAGFEASHLEAFEEMTAELGSGGWAARAAALARVAARVYDDVEGGHLTHHSALFRRARERLREAPDAALPARAVFVHGFADATGVQTDLIEALVRERGAVVFLDRPPDPADPDRRTPAQRFGAGFSQRITAAASQQSELDEEDPVALTVLFAPGYHAEARAVAERLRARIDAGSEPERLAIVARDLAAYRLPLRLHLTRLGIPFSGCGESGPRSPDGRRVAALLAVLSDRETVSAERWVEALGDLSGFGFRRDRSLTTRERGDVRLALHALGAGRLTDVAQLDDDPRFESGEGIPLPVRQGISQREEGARPSARRRRLERGLFDAVVAGAGALVSHFAESPATDRLGGHLERLRRLLLTLGWRSSAHEMKDVESLFDAAATLPADFELTGEDFELLVRRLLAGGGRVALGGRGGGVQVLNAMEARARSFDALFCMGLNRDVFPRVITEDPLLPDSLRDRLRSLIPDLPVKSEGFDEERYLFAQLVSSAPETTLSCAVTDDDGKPRPASPLIDALRRDDETGAPERVPPPLTATALETSGEAPRATRPALEYAQLAGLFGDRPSFEKLLSIALEEAGRELPALAGFDFEELARVRVAVLAELDPRGTRRKALGPYHGFVGEVRESADPRRAPLYVTTVENAARCPWKTFLTRLLRLELPPDALDSLPQFDALTLGSLVHQVLEAIVEPHLGDRVGFETVLVSEPVQVPWPDDESLDALLRHHADEALREAGVALPGFARILAEQARARVDRARPLDWPAPGSDVELLGSEVDAELQIDDGRSIRFRADRIDRTASGVRLIDYKSGRPFARQQRQETRETKHRQHVAAGIALQSAAYVRAALQAGAAAAEGRYLYLAPETDDDKRVLTARSDDEELAAGFSHAVTAVVDGWERGSFFPRLESARSEDEPRLCTNCEVKSACLRGDSGSRAQLVDWVEQNRARGDELAPAEAALLAAWELGDAP